MKTITNFINETFANGQKIDDQWINDEKLVKTADGREAKIVNIDMKTVPNKLEGIVKNNGKWTKYEWYDTGECTFATDHLGNPTKPTENDNLVKA